VKSLTQKTIGLLVSLFTIGITVHAQQIGEIYQGGYIFHISEDGTQGLVAALEDLGQFAWGCNETSISGADGQGIGTGYQNTLDIVAGCSQTPIAASEALAYELEGYSDWYLPSKDELKEMYNTIGNGSPEGDIGGFGSNWYWSSSENVSTSAWYVYFADGYTSTSGRKSPEFRVRVIRSVTFGQEMVLTECGPDEYESLAPTSNTDRECSALSICSADEYELVPATATSDRICGVAQDDVQEDVQIYSNYFNISAGGYHNLAIRPDGTVEAWGWGNGAEGTQTGVPENLTDVIQVSAFYHHASMALLKDGTVVGWGNNSNGQLDIPENLEQIVQISTGGVHILALHPDGTVSAWGWNGWGESNVPEGLENVVSVSGGWRHSVAVHSDGTVSAWGYNADGQCNVPSGLTGVVSAKAGKYNTIALLDDGTVISWGNPPSGYVFPTNLSDVIAINAGFYHGIALKSDGSVVTWGRNTDGQLNIPQNIDNVVAIDAGHRNSLLLLSDGSVVNIGNTGHPNGYSVQNIPEGLVVLVYGCTDSSAYNYDANANTDDNSCVAVVNGCTDSSAFNFDANANTDDGSCISWEEIANNLQSELDNVVIEDGIGQSDLDAAVEQAYAEGAASVTPEDGIGQADVDAAYAAGAASVTPEDGVSQADVDAAFTNGVASVEVPECEEVSTQNIPIDLPQGWSMFGYTCLDSVDAATGFSEIADQIEIVKDEWGLSYLPSWDFNALGGLHYSEGYQIKMKEAITNFQFCEAIVPEDGVTQADVDAAHAMYEGWCASDLDNDAICDADEVSGCMDETACNYVSAAEFDDGSCYNNDLGCGCDQPEAQEGYDCEGNEIITSYQIGDLAHGGMVFYVDETGQHGLVAAMEDIEGVFEWGCLGESVNGADGASIGTGYQNTLDIVNQGCSTENGGVTAAQAALDAEINSYSDWYLPSYDELREMYNAIGNGGSERNIGGFETSDWSYYLSSSELTNISAQGVYFALGFPTQLYKGGTDRVRVIRAF
jgi:hypothetical protein